MATGQSRENSTPEIWNLARVFCFYSICAKDLLLLFFYPFCDAIPQLFAVRIQLFASAIGA